MRCFLISKHINNKMKTIKCSKKNPNWNDNYFYLYYILAIITSYVSLNLCRNYI